MCVEISEVKVGDFRLAMPRGWRPSLCVCKIRSLCRIRYHGVPAQVRAARGDHAHLRLRVRGADAPPSVLADADLDHSGGYLPWRRQVCCLPGICAIPVHKSASLPHPVCCKSILAQHLALKVAIMNSIPCDAEGIG